MERHFSKGVGDSIGHHLSGVIEVTNHHMECTHFNLDYSQMPGVASDLQLSNCNNGRHL